MAEPAPPQKHARAEAGEGEDETESSKRAKFAAQVDAIWMEPRSLCDLQLSIVHGGGQATNVFVHRLQMARFSKYFDRLIHTPAEKQCEPIRMIFLPASADRQFASRAEVVLFFDLAYSWPRTIEWQEAMDEATIMPLIRLLTFFECTAALDALVHRVQRCPHALTFLDPHTAFQLAKERNWPWLARRAGDRLAQTTTEAEAQILETDALVAAGCAPHLMSAIRQQRADLATAAAQLAQTQLELEHETSKRTRFMAVFAHVSVLVQGYFSSYNSTLHPTTCAKRVSRPGQAEDRCSCEEDGEECEVDLDDAEAEDFNNDAVDVIRRIDNACKGVA